MCWRRARTLEYSSPSLHNPCCWEWNGERKWKKNTKLDVTIECGAARKRNVFEWEDVFARLSLVQTPIKLFRRSTIISIIYEISKYCYWRRRWRRRRHYCASWSRINLPASAWLDGRASASTHTNSHRLRQSRQFTLDMKSLSLVKHAHCIWLEDILPYKCWTRANFYIIACVADRCRTTMRTFVRGMLHMPTPHTSYTCRRTWVHPHTKVHLPERRSTNSNNKSTHIYCQQIFLAFGKCTRVNDILFCMGESFTSGCRRRTWEGWTEVTSWS